MISRIKQITLIDGKQLFYPSEEEVRKLGECITEIIIEETMTKDEYKLMREKYPCYPYIT